MFPAQHSNDGHGTSEARTRKPTKQPMRNDLGERRLSWATRMLGSGHAFLQGVCFWVAMGLAQTAAGQCPDSIEVLQPISCSGADDGVLTVSVPDGEDPSSVYWLFEDDTLFGVVQSGLGPGSYLAFVPGCGALGETLDEPFPFFITSTLSQSPTCDDPCSGVIEATANFGTGDVEFTWSHNAAQTGPTGTGICEQVVLITATDANGCQDQEIVVVEIPPLEVLAFGESPSCNGLSDGTVAAVASGGLEGEYSFVWTDGEGNSIGNTADVSGLSEGTYVVTATDTGGCSASTNVVLQDPPPVSIDMASEGVSCFGDTDGEASAFFSEAVFYEWSGPNGYSSSGESLDVIEGLSPGIYTAMVTAADGCAGEGATEVDEPALLVGQPFDAPPTCPGESNGTAGVVALGGTPDYSVTWTLPSGEQASGDFLNGQPAGVYSFELVDANGCTATGEVTLEEPEPISISLNTTGPSCAQGEGSESGVIVATATGGTGPYLAGWFDAETEQLIGSGLAISGLSAGVYGLGLMDLLGCVVDTIVTLEAPDTLIASVVANMPTCFGDSDGQASVVIDGGEPDFSVVWTGDIDPTIGPSIDGLGAGEYFAAVSDANGCTAEVGFVLAAPDLLELTAEAQDAGCSGEDGSIEGAASGGVLDYTTIWMGDEGVVGEGLALEGLTPGLYSGVLTDANGCAAEATVEVGQLPPVALTLDDLQLDCVNGTGAVSASATGGEPPLVVTLTGPSGEVDPSAWAALPEGEYTCTATDERGCFADTVFAIDPLLDLEVSVSPAGCGGLGQLNANAIGGSGDYAFMADPVGSPSESGAGFALWDALPPGDYVVTVDDGTCTQQASATIEGVTLFDWTVTPTEYGCPSAPGGLLVEVSGGAEPISYSGTSVNGEVSWNSADTTGLEPGQYLILALDDAGCERDTLVEVLASPELNLSVSASDMSCFAEEDGSLVVEASGGSGALAVGAQGPSGLVVSPFEGLVSGSYTVGVLDDRGCAADTTVQILEPAAIEAEVTAQAESCVSTADGSVQVVATGGTGELLVQWEGGPQNESWTGLSEGLYGWTVTDEAGCTTEGQAEVELGGGLEVTSGVDLGDCIDGVPNANVSLYLIGNADSAQVLLGGLPADEVVATSESGTWTWFNLPSGSYGWSASLGDDCGASGAVEVELPEPLVWEGAATQPLCEGDSGMVQGTASGGTLPLLIEWSGTTTQGDTLMGTGPSTGPIPAGEYSVVVSDTAGCSVSTLWSLAPLSVGLTMGFDLVQPSCGGALVGEATIVPSGGVLPYGLVVEGAADSLFLPFLVTGSYPVFLTDSVGCTATDTIVIDPASDFELMAIVDSASCANSEDGSIVLETSNGTGDPDFTFVGPFGAIPVGDTITGVGPGVYEITAIDEAGCPAVLLVSVQSPPPLFVVLDSLVRPSCAGDEDGTLVALASGGSGDPVTWSFNWFLDSALVGTGQGLYGIGEGEYAVEVIDDAGCTEEIASIPLVAEGDVSLVVPEDTTLCAGQPLSMEAYAEGAIQTSWLLPDNSGGSGLMAGVLQVEGGVGHWVFTASRLGCVRTDSVQVTGLALPAPNAGNDQTIPEGGTASLGGSANPDWDYSWVPEEDVVSSDLAATATQALFGATEFVLTAVNPEGCSATDTVYIDVLLELDVPSGFTPNGDGINDAWNLGGLDQYPSAQITIFNRWGDILLTQGSTEASWDGTLNGIAVPVGTYYYHIRVDETALQAEWTGPITLMR